LLPCSTLQLGLDEVAGGEGDLFVWAIVFGGVWAVHFLDFRARETSEGVVPIDSSDKLRLS